MTTGEYLRILRATGEYTTPADQPQRLADRLLGRWSSWYHLKILKVVVSANRAARHGQYTRLRWAEDAHRMLRAAETSGGRAHVTGLGASTRTPGAKVFVANHMSSLETFVLPGILLAIGDVATVVKASLLTYPLFGAVMRAVEPIAVGRRNPREDFEEVMRQGTTFLRAGRSVVLFPQSTRSRAFAPSTFNSLGVKLAHRAGVPVVPVAVKTDFHGIGRVIRDFGPIDRAQPIRFRFGEPIQVTPPPRAAHEQALRFITETLREWAIPVEEAAPASADNEH